MGREAFQSSKICLEIPLNLGLELTTLIYISDGLKLYVGYFFCVNLSKPTAKEGQGELILSGTIPSLSRKILYPIQKCQLTKKQEYG